MSVFDDEPRDLPVVAVEDRAVTLEEGVAGHDVEIRPRNERGGVRLEAPRLQDVVRVEHDAPRAAGTTGGAGTGGASTERTSRSWTTLLKRTRSTIMPCGDCTKH